MEENFILKLKYKININIHKVLQKIQIYDNFIKNIDTSLLH